MLRHGWHVRQLRYPLSSARCNAAKLANFDELKHRSGAMISISEAGITINNGQGATIMMTGPTVAVNGVALVIT